MTSAGNQPNAAVPDSSPPPMRVKIDSSVTFAERHYGGMTSYVAHHPGLGRFFRIGVEEYHVIDLMDGSRTVAEVHQQVAADGLAWSQEDVAKFAVALVKQKIALAETQPTEAAPQKEQSPAAPPETPGSWPQHLPRALSSMISQRIPLFSGQRIAQLVGDIVGKAFTKAGLVVWCCLVASGLLLVYGNFADFAGELRRMFDPGLWIVLLAFWCVAKIIHEMGHAVCAHRYGVRIGKVGIMFFLLAPLAYVDVTDAWKLKSRMKRVHIALAGVYLEMGIAAVAAWAWWWLPDGLLKHLAAQVFVVAGPTTLLVNANPLLRLDGYYVLSDLLEIPNLRMHGRARVGRQIERFLFGLQGKPSLLYGWRRHAATFHAACSVIFQFFWMGGLIVAVSMWARGLGVVLAIAAFLLWALLPLMRWFLKIWTLEPGARFGLNIYRRRLISYLSIVVLAVYHFCVSTSPLDRRVPVVVRFQDEQVSRASADAFVTGVYVRRGERVYKGMLLMELSDPELLLKREKLADDAGLALQREIQFRRRGDIAKANAEAENAASMKRQLKEIDDQIAGLRVIADRDGLITSNSPERLLGKYASKGEELIRVSDPSEKELLAIIHETDMDAYQSAAANRSASSVRLRGGTKFKTKPITLRPRARQSLPHPALAAAYGGPVAVEPSSNPNQPLQMIEPQLESITPLDPITSNRTRAGQVGTMTISDNRSLMARLFDGLLDTTRQ